MSAESFYGSSEYSPRAEELFALYVRGLEAGAEPDFEAYRAEHPSFADELLGLHTDWDNVRGLLDKLKDLGPDSEATPPVGAAEEPTPLSPEEEDGASTSAQGPVAEAVPAGAVESAVGRPAWLGPLAAGGLLLGVVLFIWNRNLVNQREVLARERDELEAWGLDTNKKLRAASEEGERLEREGLALDQSLAEERAQKQRLAQEHAELEERERELRALHGQLDQEHKSLSQEFEALDQSNRVLTEDFAAEQSAHAAAASAMQAAQQKLEALEALTSTKDLLAREAATWPGEQGTAEVLADWLGEARALSREAAWIEQVLGEALLTSGVTAALFRDLSALDGEQGLISRVEARRSRLQELVEQLQDEPGSAWSQALASLADPGQADPRELLPEGGFGLLPTDFDARRGLWSLADLRTVASGDTQPATGCLTYFLVPRNAQANSREFGILLAKSFPTAEQLARAGVGAAPAERPLQPKALPECLQKLGLRWPTESEVQRFREVGLDEIEWTGLPVRALGTE